jgi:N-acetylglucosaminyl-diphospho-decaprenol L-rhamnosyltransferase
MAREGPLRVAVVIVTHQSAAHVGETLAALAGQLAEDDELIVVDNGSRDGTTAVVRRLAPQAQVLEQERNLGFAGACNAGASASAAPLLLFLNPDAVPAPGCLEHLRNTAAERPDWGAWQALVTMEGGRSINTSGGITHFLGMGWAGQCGEPIAAAPPAPAEVSFASGAALMVRRDAWQRTGGFDERYFMYGEDVDISLRLRLAGYEVGIAPAARVEHDYEFGKGGAKWYRLERNRWWTVLSDYPTAVLAVLAPALALAELGLLAVAWRGGWLRAKLRAQAAVARELPAIRRRRQDVQRLRAINTAGFAEHLSASLESPYLRAVAGVAPLAAAQRTYWSVARRLLGVR